MGQSCMPKEKPATVAPVTAHRWRIVVRHAIGAALAALTASAALVALAGPAGMFGTGGPGDPAGPSHVGPSVADAETSPPLAPGALPPDGGDGTWTSVFSDTFQEPHTFRDKDLLATGNGAEETRWTNVGSRTMSQCASIVDGTLRLRSVPKWSDVPEVPGIPQMNCRLTTTRSFSGGTHLFAARVKLHTSTGHRSAFWWTGTDGRTVAEIDVFENEGVLDNPEGCKGSSTLPTNQSGFYGLNHAFYAEYQPATVGSKHCVDKALSHAVLDDQFHTMHAIMSPGEYVQFYVDGQLSATFGPQFAKSFEVNAILTNAGAETAPEFEVQWVKVWKKKGAPPTATATPTPSPACATNECLRAQLGTYAPYIYLANSNATDPRLARIIFDRRFYFDTYRDVQTWAHDKVATQGGNIWDHVEWHWLNRGIPEGRTGAATFDPTYYLTAHPDVAAAYGQDGYAGAISHYVSTGRAEGRRASVFFDPAYYKARYDDLTDWAAHAVVEHFTDHGMDEGRQGSAEFAPAHYLGTQPDLQKAFGSNYYRRGMSHWLSSGRSEGRPGAP